MLTPAQRRSHSPMPCRGFENQPARRERELREREWELHACRIRLELAEALPSLGRDAAVKKTTELRRRSSQRPPPKSSPIAPEAPSC